MSIFRNLFGSSTVTVYVSKADTEQKHMLVKSQKDLDKIHGGADYRIKVISENRFNKQFLNPMDKETGALKSRKWVEIDSGDFDDGLRARISARPNQPPVKVYYNQETQEFKLGKTDRRKIEAGIRYEVKTLSDRRWKRIKGESVPGNIFYDRIVPKNTSLANEESTLGTRVSLVEESIPSPFPSTTKRATSSTQLSVLQRLSRWFKSFRRADRLTDASIEKTNEAINQSFVQLHEEKISKIKAKYHITEASQLLAAINKLENRIDMHNDNLAKLARMKAALAKEAQTEKSIEPSKNKEPLSARVEKQQALVDAFEKNKRQLSELKADLKVWQAALKEIDSLKQKK